MNRFSNQSGNSSEKLTKRHYRIGEVSVITDVPASVLRFWETEFKKLKPRRTSSGQRLYRKKDVETVLAIKYLLYERKFTIPGARQYLKLTTGTKKKGRPDSALTEVITELETVREMLEKAVVLAK